MGSSVLCWNALWLTDSWFHSCCTYLKTYLYALYQLLSIEFLLYITEKNLMFQFASHYIHWHILHNSSLVLLFQDTWPQALRTSPLSAGTRLPWDSLTRRGCRGAQCLGLLLGHTRVLETALYLQPDKRYVLTPKRHTQTSWWTLRACRDPVGVQLVGRHLATRPSPRDAAGLQGTASLRSVLQHEWAGPGDQGSVVSWLKTGKALLFLSQRTCTGQQHCSGSCRCLVHLKFRLLLLRRTHVVPEALPKGPQPEGLRLAVVSCIAGCWVQPLLGAGTAGYMLPTDTAAPHEKRSRRLEGTGTSAPTFRLHGSSPEWVRHGSATSWLNMLINTKGKLLILRNKMAKLPLLFKFFMIFFFPFSFTSLSEHFV